MDWGSVFSGHSRPPKPFVREDYTITMYYNMTKGEHLINSVYTIKYFLFSFKCPRRKYHFNYNVFLCITEKLLTSTNKVISS